MRKLNVSAPGRICLFGEHQDYLKLPVITAAINLRVTLSGHPRNDRVIHLNLPDIGSAEKFGLPEDGAEATYAGERDTFKSVLNVVRRAGIKIENGCECTVRGKIPINSGTSSSSALNVAWVKFLIEVNRNSNSTVQDPEKIARLAYLAEVEEFGGPGGMMDQYATAVGGVLYIDFVEPVKVVKMKNQLGTFVLGDSGEPKDTKLILSRSRDGVLSAIEAMKKEDREFNLKTVSYVSLQMYSQFVTNSQFELLTSAILNRDMTLTAFNILNKARFDDREFGKLLTEHQQVLDKKLKVSTPKINHMLNNAIAAGAVGGKINGSGGGGCMFVYAPENPDEIVKVIEKAGGKAYIVIVDGGVRIE